MKTKLLFLFAAFITLHCSSFAQKEIWGTLSKFTMPTKGAQNGAIGGGNGAIFKTDSTGSNFSIEYSFSASGGMFPEQTKLCEANNGKLYGMTRSGGFSNNGVIFEFDPQTGNYSVKYEFNSTSQFNPMGSLVKAPNGLLYGLTYYGGVNNYGVLFEYNPVKNTYVKKFDFYNNFGTYPSGSLTLANNGKLYGMTSNGGTNSYGTLFEFNPQTGVTNKMVEFTIITGSNPTGDLTLAANGKLYGLTQGGGQSSAGVLFEYTPGADSISKRAEFNIATNGGFPKGSLLSTSTGKLYGMTYGGGIHNAGVIFEYSIALDSIITKFNLDSTITGYGSSGNLMEDSSHRFYGMAPNGGVNLAGTLFEFLPASDTCIVKVNFINSAGQGFNPRGTLMQASNNKIYGLTNSGSGPSNGGVLFEYDTTSNTIINKAYLNSNFGIDPQAGLLKASNGKLYGTTKSGGKLNSGVIYEYDPSLRKYTILHDFNDNTDGSNPLGELLEGNNGQLYGTASKGGPLSGGTLFKFNVFDSTFTTLHSFDTATGYSPLEGLVLIADTLYGMTQYGGSLSFGVIFKMDTSALNYSVMLNFDNSVYGANPTGKLLKAKNGNLFGVTPYGGVNFYGTLFEYNLSLDTCYVRTNFQYNCMEPMGSLMQASNDTLYGLSSTGGMGYGALYSYNINSYTTTIKKSFDWSTYGAYPKGDLMQASNGNLIGTTSDGGYFNKGTIFNYNITTDSLIVSTSINTPSGPSMGSLIEMGCYPWFSTAYATICKGETYSFGTQTLTTSGTYNELFTSSTGCDSTVTLHLSVSCPSVSEYWGMTPFGGANNKGAIYKVNEKGENYSLEYSFSATSDGVEPYGSLVQASNGKFYGMTAYGGASNSGVIFEYNPTLKTYTKKIDFDGTTKGATPSGDLVKLPNGILFGVTESGGVNNAGVLFKYNPDSNIFIKLIDFDTIPFGAKPSGSLTLADNGKLYGTTAIGGSNNMGALFEFNPANNAITKRVDFTGSTNGSSPTGLILATNGLLYGLASNGGPNGSGVLYEYNTLNYSCSTRLAFGYQYGSFPQGKLVQDPDGKLFGVTLNGGNYNSGIIFRYNISINSTDTLYSFDSISTGYNPRSGLTLSSNGNLLGTTNLGGLNNNGVVFEYNFSSINKKHDFSGSDGANPYYGTFLLAKNYPIYDTINQLMCEGDTILHGPNTITTAGLYTAFYKTASGLDSTVTLNVTVNPIQNVNSNATICDGNTYNFNGQFLTVGGIYVDTLPSITGCDSIITLTLTVNPVFNDSLPVTICQGQTFILGSQTLDSTGVFTELFTSVTGCDSIVTVSLTVNPVYNVNDTVSICQGGSYLFFGNPLTVAGNYSDTVPSVLGCDSIVQLTLLVNPTYNDTIAQTICAGNTYILGSQSLDSTGVYTELFSSVTGCDSIVTVSLTVNPVYNVFDTATICLGNSYLFFGNPLTVAGNYSDTVPSVLGCDSIVQLTLNVNPTFNDTITATICSGNTYTLGSQTLDSAGIYSEVFISVTGCDSTVTVILGVDPLPLKPTMPVGDLVITSAITSSIYTTDSAANAVTYNWLLEPAEAGSISGIGVTSTVNWLPAYNGMASILVRGINSCGNGVYSDTLVVNVANHPQASFSYTILGDSVDFTNTSTGTYTDAFWDFGDGTFSNNFSDIHEFPTDGYYTVTLTVYDAGTDYLNSYSDVVLITSHGAAVCKADFVYTVDQYTLTFQNQSIGGATEFFWDFGDGQYSYEENPKNIYAGAGYYDVTLSIYNNSNQCFDYVTLNVLVEELGVAVCKAEFSYYPVENTVYFTSTAIGTYSQHFWDFGNGFGSNLINPEYTFEKPGYYEIAYSVIDTVKNCFDTRKETIFVPGSDIGTGSTKISADYSYMPENGTNNVLFSDKSLGTVTNWYWDFGDNTPANTLQNPDHLYTINDYYRVCLTASNSSNQSSKCEFIAVGDVSKSSTAYFTYFADTATSTARFKNQSLGDIKSYFWDFGDGNISVQKNPSHTYADTGYYAVCLTTVSGFGVSKTYCDQVRIGNIIDNPCLFSCVWPGDANNDLEANHYDIMTLGLNYNLHGPKRIDATTNWIGQTAQNWSTYQLDGTNNKHGDCNGDGAINADDLTAIEQNFAFSHYWTPDVKASEWKIGCQWEPEGNKAAGTRRQAKAILIRDFKGALGSMYALGYEIEVVGGEKIVWSSLKISFDNSWIGVDGKNMLTISQIDSINHMIYVGMTRTDQTDTLGSGEIASFDFEFKPGFDATGVSFNVTTKGGIISSGETTGIGGSISLELTSPIVLCAGSTAILDAGSGFDHYIWSTGATDTSRVEVTAEGPYYVTVSNNSGAIANDTIEVVLHSLPVIYLGNDITQNDSLVLDAGSGFFNYLWSTGDTIQTITVKESGEYSVQVMNSDGCTGSDTIQVTIVTGINAQIDKNITVFPNPNNGKFWLVYEFNPTSSTVVEVVNTNGKTVWRSEVKDYSGRNFLVDANNLEKGVYLLKVVDKNRIVTKRFIIL